MEPSQEAVEVATNLIEAHDLQKKILKESAESGTESGRAICAQQEMMPLDRGFSHVSLPGCDVDHAGMIHGGGGHDFDAPEHSLIDMAIVLFERPQASLVVGRRESDVFMAPRDLDREEAIRRFREALGVDVHSPDDVSAAVNNGEVNPVKARSKIRRDLRDLFVVVQNDLKIEPIVEASPEAEMALSDVEDIVFEEEFAGLSETVVNALRNIWKSVKGTFTIDPSNAQVNLIGVLASEIAGALILLLLLRVFGTSPKRAVSRAA